MPILHKEAQCKGNGAWQPGETEEGQAFKERALHAVRLGAARNRRGLGVAVQSSLVKSGNVEGAFELRELRGRG